MSTSNPGEVPAAGEADSPALLDREESKQIGKSGVISSVVGRGTARGIPEVHQGTFTMDDGSILETRMPALNGVEATGHHLPMEIGYLDFGECPICLEPTSGTREHVPPQSIGGNVLTRTCETCNSKFGSLYEPHLQTWYQGSTGHIRISGGDVLGRRHGGEYLVRETQDGKPVLFSTGYVDPTFQQMLLSGKFEIAYPVFDEVAVRLAAIKTAYLAACLFLKMIPRTDHAVALRAELIAARDHSGD